MSHRIGVHPQKVVGAERVLAVLVELGKYATGISLDELTSILGESKPTVHRALATLQKSGLATKTERGSYLLGDEFVRIANKFQFARPEVVNLEPVMRKLSSTFGETVHYAVLDGIDVVYRAKIDAPEGPVKLSSVIGGRNPAYCTAVGKLLLGYEYEDYESFLDWASGVRLKRKTDNTITSTKKLWESIVASHEQGFAVDDQENELGINCIAFPVFSGTERKPTGALSISGLAFRTPIAKLVSKRREILKIVQGI
jgi:IclR family transcriptional regulator, acetate operon repressor